MNYLRVKNWDHFQHYKDRSPPWIKLHRDLLRDYDFLSLQDASKLHLMMIWLLASQMDNKIPADEQFIRNQIGVKSKIDFNELLLKGFLIDDSGLLATSKQLALGETETETETEAYRTDREEAEVPANKVAVDMFNDLAKQKGLPIVQRITKVRESRLNARLKDCGGLSGWENAIEKIRSSDFLTGNNKNGWKMDFDFLLQESSFVKLMEGKYDNTEGKSNGKQKLANDTDSLLERIRSGESG